MPFPSQQFHGNQKVWTRGHVIESLRQAAHEIQGPLPCHDAQYSRLKKGRLDWPPAARVLEYFHSMARGWLAAGADPTRVQVHNIGWTEAEDTYLLEHAGDTWTLKTIAKHLGRTYGATRRRLRSLHTTARSNSGFMSAATIAKEYGCPYHRVREILRKGIIPASYDAVRNSWQVDPKDLTPAREALLRAPKAKSYRATPPDLGDYYKRYGLRRKVVDGKVRVVEEAPA